MLIRGDRQSRSYREVQNIPDTAASDYDDVAREVQFRRLSGAASRLKKYGATDFYKSLQRNTRDLADVRHVASKEKTRTHNHPKGGNHGIVEE